MKKILMSLSLVLPLLTVPAYALKQPQDFGTCLTDALTGKERKQLAQWIYFSMAAHPEFADFSQVSVTQKRKSDEFVGKLVTRLVAEDCPQEGKAAIEQGGAYAFAMAFKLVGEVAMQEIMTDRSVQESVNQFEQYLDQDKLNAVFGE